MWWYSTSQGSRLIPLRWFLALEDPAAPPAKPDPFLSPRNLERWGYLPAPPSAGNPHGLPLGFVVDEANSQAADLMCDRFPESCKGLLMRQQWAGMTCAACHTNIIAFGGKRVLVEGAPTLSDFQSFVEDLGRALEAVAQDGARFGRFASAVLGDGVPDSDRDRLRMQLAEQIAWHRQLAQANHSRIRHGHARLDAQGYILNKIAAIANAPAQRPVVPAEAPASYPTIWNAPQLDRLQWNGVAQNYAPEVPVEFRTDLGALIRNTSEVIGVFAHIETDGRQAAQGYPSSIRFQSLVEMEQLLTKLKSPRWPEDVLGPIDRDKAERGRAVFEAANCGSCHRPLAWDDLVSKVKTQMVPIAEVRTDIGLACNTFFHRSNAGHLSGQKVYFHREDIDQKIADEDFTRNMLTNTILGAIQHHPVVSGVFKVPELSIRADDTPQTKPVAGFLARAMDAPPKSLADTCLETQSPLLAYKARPLNGIWASAPYLHNGAVPTLYDLFLPSTSEVGASAQTRTRPDVFSVGSRQFDPAKVGFVSAPAGYATTFRVRDERTGEPVPGNSNAGHPYGTALTEAERYDLIEYLKTL